MAYTGTRLSGRGKRRRTTYWLRGRQVSKAEYRKEMGAKLRINLRGRPMIGAIWKNIHSTALAVLPEQRNEAIEHSIKVGVPTHFDREGCPVFTSRGHRKRYCEAYGVFDMDAGYGDPQPR